MNKKKKKTKIIKINNKELKLEFYCPKYKFYFYSPESCLKRQFFFLCNTEENKCEYGEKIKNEYGHKVKIQINPELSETKKVLKQRKIKIKKIDPGSWPPNIVEIIPFPKENENK